MSLVGRLISAFAAVAFWATGLQAHAQLNPDVIVVGGGAAGLAAAVSAAENGASVLLLEKGATLGGNAWFSGGYYNAVDPKQKGLKDDSVELFVDHMLDSGGGKNSSVIVRRMAEEAYRTKEWLEAKGLKFLQEPTESFGGRWNRSYRTLESDGRGFIRTLLTDALKRGVMIEKNAQVIELGRNDSGHLRIVGYLKNGNEHKAYARKGIILAAGGFSANKELIKKVAPRLANLSSDNVAANTGEVMLSAEKVGAVLVNMAEIECLPGAREGSSTRGRLHGNSARFVLLNHKGERFIREDAKRSEIRDAVLKLPQKMAYVLVDNEGLKSYSKLVRRDTIRSVEKGDIIRADTLEELAEKLQWDPKILKKTIDRYNEAVQKREDELGKRKENLTHKLLTAPFWVSFAPMAIHNTLGGLAVDEEARVLDKNSIPIDGLFAAGEITGLTHGSDRLGGNGLTEALTFGRIAGKNCATAP